MRLLTLTRPDGPVILISAEQIVSVTEAFDEQFKGCAHITTGSGGFTVRESVKQVVEKLAEVR